MVYPKRPAPQGNNFLCSLSLYITHPSFGHQFQLFTQCQVYFQVSTFLLCHCIFPFSCNVLALHLLAFQAGSNVKCVWGPERVFWFLGVFLTTFFAFCACTSASSVHPRKVVLLNKSVKYLCRSYGPLSGVVLTNVTFLGCFIPVYWLTVGYKCCFFLPLKGSIFCLTVSENLWPKFCSSLLSYESGNFPPN